MPPTIKAIHPLCNGRTSMSPECYGDPPGVAKGNFDLKRGRGGGAFDGEVEELGVVQRVQVPGVENGGADLEGVGGDVDGGHATTDDGVALEDPVKLR
ncbi:hypothetical protein ACFX2C_035320 [Malus domestica]